MCRGAAVLELAAGVTDIAQTNKEVLRKRKEQESFRKKISYSESDDLLKVV